MHKCRLYAGFLFFICSPAAGRVIMLLMNPIISHQNPRIKKLRALRRRKERDAEGLCVVEGLFHVGEALAAYEAGVGGAIDYICIAPDLLVGNYGHTLVDRASQHGIPIYSTTADILTAAAGKENPQGLLAVVRQRHHHLSDLSPSEFPWAVAVVAPQDPGNVGTILRTIDAVGASGLILIGDSVDPYHPTALRAAMGTTFWLPVVRTDYADFMTWVRQNGYHLVGTSASGTVEYRTAAFDLPLILLLGSEREGLSAEQVANCDLLLSLPMQGRAGSLNLAVAAGVFLYAIHDQIAP